MGDTPKAPSEIQEIQAAGVPGCGTRDLARASIGIYKTAGVRRLQMALDEDVARLAKGKNLATVVTLMPSGQPQALLTWVDADDEHVLVNTEPQRQRARNVSRD